MKTERRAANRWMAAWTVLACFGIGLSVAYGAALSAERNTPQRTGDYFSFTQGSNVVYAGSIVAVNSSQLVVPASDTAGLKVIGRAQRTQDNTGGAYLATRTLEIAAGTFRWENGGSFTLANIGDLAYVSDDQTVTTAASVTHDVIAGVIVDVDASGVWVKTFDIGSQGAGSLTTLNTSGNAAIGGTLAVTGVATFTAESVHNLGLDTDYVTTDAGAGVDTKTAGALLLGAATATSVVVGASDAQTIIAGRLYMGTNGYWQVTGNVLQFIGHNGFTNTVIDDITQ